MKLQSGTYRHFKGREYRVLGVAKHSETLENVVVYEALSGDGVQSLWVRPLRMFTEEIDFDGEKVSRFKYIGK